MRGLASRELTEEQFETISTMVKSLCGINLHDGKRELIKARLNKRLVQLDLEDFSQYIQYVRNDPTGVELTMMLDALSTNLTSFFREAHHFEHLRQSVVPRAARAAHKLRIWSAGCSSGEEPYSIALSLADEIPDAWAWDIRILATDISAGMLERARNGLYPRHRLPSVPPRMRKYFRPTDDGQLWEVAPCVRKMVTFSRLNLMDPWPMRGPFDAIFCRNVMIYFDKETQQRLVNQFWDLLAPGGTMFLGHSESLSGIRHRFKYIRPAIYEKQRLWKERHA